MTSMLKRGRVVSSLNKNLDDKESNQKEESLPVCGDKLFCVDPDGVCMYSKF